MQNDNTQPGFAPALMTRNEVAHYIGCNPKSGRIHSLIRAGKFPRPLKLAGTKTARWRRTDIDAWIAAQPTERGDFSFATVGVSA